MAADDILLSTNDLLGFNNSASQGSTYNLLGKGLDAWNPNMSTWSPVAQGITSFGKSFLQGYLQNQARADAASQLQSVVGVLPQLRTDPYNVAAPEGVDSNAFSVLKGSAILRNAALAETKKDRLSGLMQSVLGNAVQGRQMSPADAISVASSDDPETAIRAIAPTTSAVSDPLEDFDNPLASGRDSSAKKLQSYFKQFMASGMPATQAATAAKEQIEGEIKSNNKSFDEAKAARENGQKLLTLANTAETGMTQAGQTGSGLASAYEKTISALSPILPGSQEEAKRQSAGDALISSIAPDLLVASRPAGVGAMSDPEMRVYLSTGPSPDKTPEENAILIQKMKNVGQLNIDYADFLEAYRDANSGSTAGAGKKWDEYKSAFPIFKNGEINTERPAWQDYFAGVGSGAVPSTTAAAVTQPESNKYSIGDLKAAGYSDSDIAALRSKGVVR